MKKFIIIVITLLVLSNTYLLYNNYNLKKQVLSYEEKANIRRKNAISMMLETEANSKTYVQSTDNKWPTDGYIFNEKMSKCEQGSKLKWDDNNQKVIMEGNVSDKCYVFFDKYNPIKINSSSVTANGNNIVITVNATSGTGSISKYFYSKDNGSNYVESTSNTYTFTNLTIGKYNVKFYVMDSNGKKSEIISKNIEISGMVLSEYIKSKFTGTQGTNGLYYHSSSLANGAGDNSYRYAGASADVKNYICIGSSETTCPTDNLYRIIGVFGDNNHGISGQQLVKVIKNTSWGTYQWDSSGSSTWSSSSLYSSLNSSFLNINMSGYENKIATVKWKLGTDRKTIAVPVKTFFDSEITNTTSTVSAKIGLMYLSDFGFAIQPGYWTTNLNSYNNVASGTDWLLLGDNSEWVISVTSGTTGYAVRIATNGYAVSMLVTQNHAARPTFYLTSDVLYISGSGTSSDPIRIK